MFKKKDDFDLTPSEVSKSWRHKKPFKKRVLAVFLCMVVAMNIVALPIMASSISSNKEEVVYINLLGDGQVESIYVVNTFDINEEGQIIDYGDYSALRNMTNNETITFEDEKVSIDTEAGKFYYEGKLNHDVIPWNFDIGYTIDGVETASDQMAGQSGHMAITFSATENKASKTNFFDDYALQIILELDSNKTANLIAKKASQANVGKYKQLMYTVMPGEETSIVIEADVTEFEMSGIIINAVPLAIDFEVDLDENEEIEDLQSGVRDLNDGSIELDDGASELQDGAVEIKDGVLELQEGAIELEEGVIDLKDGIKTLLEGSIELDDGLVEMLDGVIELNDGTIELVDGVTELNDGALELYDGSVELDEGVVDLLSGSSDLKNGVEDLDEASESLYIGLATISAQNTTVQDMSMMLYNKTLIETSALLASEGYEVTSTSSADELQEMLTSRQSNLTDETQQASATNSAITNRMTELGTIVATGTPEEQTVAQLSLDYWQMTMAIQGESAYQTLLGQTDLATADASEYGALHVAYDNYVLAFGDVDTFMANYGAIDAQAGTAEQTLIEAAVTSALTESVSDDSIVQTLAALSYYKGVIDYTEGVLEAMMGSGQLNSGTGDLLDGAKELYEGVIELKKGTTELLDGTTELIDGVKELKEGTIELYDGVITLHDGVIELSDGTLELVDGVVELDDGSIELYDGTIELNDGVVTLLDGAIELCDGALELKDGTIELVDGVIELNDKTTTASLEEKITKAIDDTMRKDQPIMSFASAKNGEVSLVQFIMKTPAIEIVKESYVEEVEADETGVIEKFLALFGLQL